MEFLFKSCVKWPVVVAEWCLDVTFIIALSPFSLIFCTNVPLQPFMFLCLSSSFLLHSYYCKLVTIHILSISRSHFCTNLVPCIFPLSLSHQERPKSALERLSSPTEDMQLPSSQPRGRMTAEEQLERMKRHHKALVRERKRNLSHGERLSTSAATTQRSSSSSSSRLPSSTSDPPPSVRYPPPPRSSSRHREHHLHHHCCYATLQPPAT